MARTKQTCVARPAPIKKIVVARRPTIDSKKVAIKKTAVPMRAVKKPVVKAPARVSAKQAVKMTAKTVPKVTKKVIAKKPALSPEEKAKLKEEREILKAQRLKIREEKARIRAEKERIKQEKLRMWELVPTTSVPLIKTNPYLSVAKGARENPNKGCCLFCNNREVVQAAVNKDAKALKTLLNDTANISNPFQKFAIDCPLTSLRVIVQNRDFDSFKLIIDYLTKALKGESQQRAKLPQIALSKIGTGHQNTYSHNFPMRQVKLSRGGKEGNNAFTYDSKLRGKVQIDFQDVLKLNPPMSFVRYMLTNGQGNKDQSQVKTNVFNSRDKVSFISSQASLSRTWAKAVRKGNYPLVKHIFEQNKKQRYLWISRLHECAILQGKAAEEVKMMNRNALLKQTNDDDMIVPAQIACINPDPTILENYFRMYPTTLQLDAKGRDLVHYAVMNENAQVLAFLLSKRQMVNNADSDNVTPLMLACKYGKLAQVNMILEDQERQKKALDKKDKDYEHYLKFYSYVDSVGPYQNTPLHYAMRSGSLPIVKALVQAGGSPDKKNFYNDTPLSVACQLGHVDIADFLIREGANIHGVDKQQRTPLIRACQNGQVHVVSMLLRKGVNANFCDLSENTALHHACAYGWLNVVKLLVEGAKADINRLNEWKSSPTIIAMLKGHFGIVDYLLSRSEIDASLVDDQGRSLIAQLCLHLNEDSFKNLKFLISKKKINVGLKTVEGLSPLHILACNDVAAIARETVTHKEEFQRKPTYFMRRGKRIKVAARSYYSRNHYSTLPTYISDESDRKEYPKVLKQLETVQLKCAELLIQHGCSVNDLTTDERPSSVLFFAVQSKSYALAQALIARASTSTIEGKDAQDQNVLHLLADDFIFHGQSTAVLESIVRKFGAEARKLAAEEDSEGMKPLHNYYNYLKDKFSDHNFCNMLNSWQTEVQKFLMPCLRGGLRSLIKVAQIYAKSLAFDVSARIGIPSNLKEEAKELMEQGGIKKTVYDKLLRLELDECKGKKEKGDQDEDKKVTYTSSGVAIDPQKSQMGVQIKVQDEDEGNSGVLYRGRRAVKCTARKSATRAYRGGARARRRFAAQSESEEDEDQGGKNKKFDPVYYYSEGQTLSNSITLLIKTLKKFNERKNSIAPGIQDQIVSDLESSITGLLTLSKALPRAAGPKAKAASVGGFNLPDKKGATVLTKALNLKMVSLARKMIESGCLDLTAQQKVTGLTPMHLIANHIEDMTTIQVIFSAISQSQVSVKDKNGNTPLHYAAMQRNLPMCQMLCEVAKLDVNAKNSFGCTPLHICLFAFNERKDHSPALERYLISKGANSMALDSDKRIPLVYLFWKGREPVSGASASDPAPILQTFQDSGFLTQKELKATDRTGNTLLHYACMAGATICAMSLIQAGAQTTPHNIVGNSPLAMALAHGQQQICTFMIPNRFGLIEPVALLESDEQQAVKDEVKGLILPADLHQRWFVESGDSEGRTDSETIDADYKVKMQTPNYLAMSHGWDGVGFLLTQMKSDKFVAITGCLQARKYGKFLDLLEGMPREVVTQKDGKGRDLVLILARYLGEMVQGSTEMNKALEVISTLTTAPKKQQSAASQLIATQNSYGLSLMTKDSRGYNILHTIALHSSLAMFENVLKSISVPQARLLLSDKSSVKYQATPLVILALSLESDHCKARFIDLMTTVRGLVGAAFFKTLPLTYVEQAQEGTDEELPDYLDFSKPLISDHDGSQRKGANVTHLVELLFTDFSAAEGLTDEKLNEMFVLCEPFLGYQNAKTGETLLMKLVKSDPNQNAFHYLLGSQYDPVESKNFFTTSKQKVRVNLNAQDAKGRTALHYAIQPSDKMAGKGFRQDTDTVKALLAKGASIKIKDGKGVSPIDLARKCKPLIELFNPKSERPVPLVKKPQQPAFENCVRPYSADAEAYLAAQMARIKASQMQVDSAADKPECAVDDHEDLKNCEVVQSDVLAKDGESKLYYDIVLIKVDVKAQYYGINNFYVIQLLRDKAKDLYILWTRWGRIGDVGQYQRTPFPNLLSAQIEFAKVFRQKSGNKWDDVVTFENIHKKYKLRRLSGKNVYLTADMKEWQTQESEVDMSKVLMNFAEHTNLRKSTLSPAEFDFIKPLVDSAYLLRRLKKQKFSDNLVFETLLDSKVLGRLYTIVTEMLRLVKTRAKSSQERDFEAYSEATTRLFDLNNQFYELSTPTEFAFDKLESLDCRNTIVSQFKKLQRLRDLEHASQLLMAAAHHIKAVNPYDFVFRQLSCNIRVLQPESDSYSLLMRYVNSGLAENAATSQRKYTLKNIYEVGQSSNQDPPLFKNLHQHTMLFHGTSKANLLSIIEQGMQIKPQNAAFHNGSAFGEGIYLADDFMFAANYSESKSEKTFYVLVCEVALGNVMNSLMGNRYNTNSSGYFVDGSGDFAKGYHSVRVMGRKGPDFNQNWIQAGSDVIWPIGDHINYPAPEFKLKSNDEQGLTNCREIVEASKPKTKKKPKKKAKKKGAAARSDSESESEAEDSCDDNDLAIADKVTKPRDVNVVMNSFEAHEVHHFPKGVSKFFSYGDFNYCLGDSQYVIANQDQVKLKYIVQVNKV